MSAKDISVTINEYGKTKTLFARSGRLLKDLLKKEGIDVSFPCGGQGSCGGCRIRFAKGAPEATSLDRAFIGERDIEQGYRLLCRAVVTGDCEINLASINEEDMAILESGLKIDRSFDGKRAIESRFAIAVDLGTTTIAAALVEKNGDEFNVVKTGSCVNHQRKYGADVVSRISAAEDVKALKDMSALAVSDIHALVKELLEWDDKITIPRENVTFITIAGNTTMENLFAGRDVSWLGRYPYTPPRFGLGYERMEADPFFIVMPGISAFVGADIVSGIYYLRSAGYRTNNALFIDLGTNGEMVYADGEKMKVTSTAAGPVFEAGGISCGVPSIPGAICHVKLVQDGDDFCCSYETIGDKEPIGLCGTGVLELVSEAVRVGLVDATGLLNDRYFDEGFPVTDDGNVRLTQQDVRNVQLGKAAIYTGAVALLEGKIPDVVYLAGGFGSHLDPECIRNLRMFPGEFDGKIVPVGNTSLMGAISFSKRALKAEAELEAAKDELELLAKKAKVVELATRDEFDKEYIEAMSF